ncbi:MAG: LytTR family transcriptional regulator [Opitutaceae bacterium]|nr:LytTR family transcriptional regulator [Opitutaceae bacterium]
MICVNNFVIKSGAKVRQNGIAAEPRAITMMVEAFKVAGCSAPLLVKLAHAVSIKAQGDYTQISLDYGAKHLVRRTTDAWIKLLNGTSFFRLDRSTIINLAHVVSYRRTSRDHAWIRLQGLKEPVHIGRRAILRLDQEHKLRPPQFKAG